MSRKDPRHGTINGYRVDNCRCDRCREAKKLYERERRAAFLQRSDITHGLQGTWDAGCRCSECGAAHRNAYASYYWASPRARLLVRLRGQRRRGVRTATCHICLTPVGLSSDGSLSIHGSPECGGSRYWPRSPERATA